MAGLVFAMVVLGGLTRLTESGLRFVCRSIGDRFPLLIILIA